MRWEHEDFSQSCNEEIELFGEGLVRVGACLRIWQWTGIFVGLVVWQLVYVRPGMAYSQETSLAPELQDQFKDIAKDLRCPTCTGISVLESDAEFSVQIKDKVIEQLRQGKSRTDVMAFFVDRYGPWILREPPREGISLMAWIVPIGLMVLGPFGVWFLVWRRRKVTISHRVRSAAEILAQMETELSRLRLKRGAQV